MGLFLFHDLPSYVVLDTPCKIAGLLCRLRLKVSKLREHLHYRHLTVNKHAGLPADCCLLKCPLCLQDAIRNFHRYRMVNLFGNHYPFINFPQSSLSMINNNDYNQSLIAYVSSNVDEDSMEHLLFKCPSFNRFRLIFDIPTIISNDNVKLLLGQSMVSYIYYYHVVAGVNK